MGTLYRKADATSCPLHSGQNCGSHCRCCCVPQDKCGKRQVPYTKKHAPARGGVRRERGWANDNGCAR